MVAAHDACPLCGGTSLVPEKKFASQHLARCRSCGFHFSRRIPTETELSGYYGNYPIKPPTGITLQRYHELLDRFEPYRRLGTLLDVGCGGGDFLSVAKGRGWTVHGTEYGDAFVAAAASKGVSMRQGALDAANYSGIRFDVIVSFEVIEHLGLPMDMLRNAEAILRPGGLMYVTTPNYNALNRWLSGHGWDIVNYPEHLSYFTKGTIHRALSSIGLKRSSLHTTGFSVTRLRTSHRPDGRINTLPPTDDEALRATFEGSAVMRTVKRLVNGTLDLLGKGDTLKATYTKPA